MIYRAKNDLIVPKTVCKRVSKVSVQTRKLDKTVNINEKVTKRVNILSELFIFILKNTRKEEKTFGRCTKIEKGLVAIE